MTTHPLNLADRYQRRWGDAAPAPQKPVGVFDAGRQDRRPPRQTARGSRPNKGLEAIYRRRIGALADEMNASVLYWIASAYRNNPPEMMEANDEHLGSGCHGDNSHAARDVHAGDWGGDTRPSERMAFDRRTPADLLKDAFDALAKRWLKRFDDAAGHLANWFAHATQERSDATLRDVLRRGGFSVRFQMTPAMRDIADATVHENVALIRSIPQQYLTQVEGAVMRSVSTGRDLASLTKDLREQHGVTKRRAKFIALDQNNKATSAFTRARQMELGMTTADWMHSHAGKHPRPTHVANNGKPYDPAKGWWDPAIKRHIWPGTEPGCRCFSRTRVPGFE